MKNISHSAFQSQEKTLNPCGIELRHLGRLVAAERNRRGISLRQAAQDTGIPFNTLARVEKGQVPNLRKFKRLADWCGTDIRQFFTPPPGKIGQQIGHQIGHYDGDDRPGVAERPKPDP